MTGSESPAELDWAKTVLALCDRFHALPSAVLAEDSALLAALVRALVAHVGPAVDQGDEGPMIPPELLRLAYWRAARDGLAGEGVDVVTGRLVPAATQARRLFAQLRPELTEHGDLDLATGWLERLIEHGGGAAQQRRAYTQRGALSDVVDYLVHHTAPH